MRTQFRSSCAVSHRKRRFGPSRPAARFDGHATGLRARRNLKRPVRLAQARPDCGAILILFDGDSAALPCVGRRCRCGPPRWRAECAAPWSLPTANAKPGFLPGSNRCAVTAESGTTRRPTQTLRSPGAKEQWESRMDPDAADTETTHQPAFSAMFSLSDAHRRSRSFRKLASSFGNLVRSVTAQASVGVAP